MTFASVTTTLLDKVAALSRLTFVGTLRGKEVVAVTITRTQALSVRKVEEEMGACGKKHKRCCGR